MRRSVELEIITEALSKMGPHTPAVRLWGRAPGATADMAAEGNVWAGDVHDVARHIVTRLHGRPDTPEQLSPLAQAEDAKRRRNLVDELAALTGANQRLVSAPWYPARPGDLVHVHYEQAGESPATGETYIVSDAGDGLLSMQLLALSPTVPPAQEQFAGAFACEASDSPLHEAWFEAGPQRLTIVRDGQAVHDGPAALRARTEQSGLALGSLALAQAVSEAEKYLERGEPDLALARLRSDKPLPPCGAPGFTSEQSDCARPRQHRGACSENPDHVEPAHECPALPEQLHAVVTVGAKVTGVHFAGLYEDSDAAADVAAGYQAFAEGLNDRFVQQAPGLPGEIVLELPAENELASSGVQLAVVVPLQLLPDPRAYDEWAAEGMATCVDPDPYYGRDLDDEDDYRDGE
ncbi:hypothetical protein [Streptomyces sp. SID13726]|uniref:hypothetical protein n=1 Tax=Streptomyces sp. SID13726 TaxID=2706058 RepID=UPI0013BE7061|nr:hypothetical protein [Streptomyces sp. SID13726]NEB00597.1 hypothetical protein [Streptomyces sp. SID13726]